ncbi:MAG TPA: hypothetical protein VNA88_02590 [Candidatus Kapabacteria bacterium]|nr:hypothetical protein [Candidatus Kapabacteria bacterium]
MITGIARRSLRRLPEAVFAMALLAATPVIGQTNFSFFLGATALESQLSPATNLGASVGLITKFNVVELVRLRGQVHVDKVQVDDVTIGSFHGRESVTMVCFGFGGELAVGGRDVDVFVNATPHGTIRTTFRTETADDGSVHVSSLTRFSLGMVFGAGVEVFITDNIGFELQAQYDIFNFDHDETDPLYTGTRALAGLQFYLGRNFAR